MNYGDAHAKKQALLLRIQTEGAEAAYAAALGVCRDPKAPAPARATCATTILRAGGYLNAKGEEDSGKEPHEMTASEINSRLHELRTQRQETDSGEPEAFG